MEKLITTPYKFMWQIKTPQNYWSDYLDKAKYIVYVNGKRKGRFCGVNKSFDEDMYYVNFWDNDNRFDYCGALRNTEMILEPIE